MKLYDENGYVNIRAIINQHQPFNFVWGGRGTGKTYGALSAMIEDGERFMLMRRTQTQLDLISKPEFSPFKSINQDKGYNVGIVPLSKYNGGIYNLQETEGKLVPSGPPIGYTCALSTVTNIRGFDASDVQVLIYDEFIPEAHSKPIKGEADAFLNAYETINRNRELTGKPPLQVLCLANANRLANPLFIGLGLLEKAEAMSRHGQELSIIGSRGICMVNLCRSEISGKKRATALYRFTGDNEFSQMALSNKFGGEDDISAIGSRPLREYTPLVTIGEITIYRHKSRGEYHVSTHKSGAPTAFGVGEMERERFKKCYFWLWREYIGNRVTFENRLCEILLTEYFK